MERWQESFHEGNDGLQRLLKDTNMKWNPDRSFPPVEALGHEPDEMEYAMCRLNWWRKIDKWLWHLVLHIEHSLDKNFGELSAWNEECVCLDFADRVNSGVHSFEEEDQKIANWNNWVNLEDHSESCSRTSTFSGGYYIPRVDGVPTSVQMEHVSHFFDYHHSEMAKHYEHLKYLHQLITGKLMVDVENKIERLMHEIDVLEVLVPEPEPDNDIVRQSPTRFPVIEEAQPVDSIEDEFWVSSGEEEDYEVEEEVTEHSGAELKDTYDKKPSLKNLVIGSDDRITRRLGSPPQNHSFVDLYHDP